MGRDACSRPAGDTSVSATYYTEWCCPTNPEDVDFDKHVAFTAFARGVVESSAPWLIPLLEASSAKVLFSVGSCGYLLPGIESEWIDIPEIARRLHMVPWVETDEIAH